MQIDIKYFGDTKPLKNTEVGDWIDLSVRKDIYIAKGNVELIPLGVAMKLPKGYEAFLLPRSSTLSKHGVMVGNSMGIIDESYSGNDDEWKLCAYAIRDTVIPKGTRIAQFRIIEHMPMVSFNTVDNLSGKNRGGFGSTGD